MLVPTYHTKWCHNPEYRNMKVRQTLQTNQRHSNINCKVRNICYLVTASEERVIIHLAQVLCLVVLNIEYSYLKTKEEI
jgi:hypothetical protein